MKNSSTLWSGGLAALSFATAVLAFGAALEGYRQMVHPVALLGAQTVPHALTFDLIAFVLPGALAAWSAMTLRAVLTDDTHWSARIGARLVLLAAIAFAAQGLFPLDPADLEALATRLHATAWTMWWVAFVPGALLLSTGLWRRASGRSPWARRLALASASAAVLVALFAASPWQWLPPGAAQRIGYAAWFGWLVLCGAAVDALRRSENLDCS